MTTTIDSRRPAGSLVRVARQYSPRRVAFWNRERGYIISDTGQGRMLTTRDTPLSWPLDTIAAMPNAALRPRVLYLIGGETVATEPPREWWAEPTAAGLTGPWRYDGYEIASASGEGGHLNAGTYTNGDGVTVDVRMSARWFPGVTDPRVCVDAWKTLAARLRGAFDDRATLLTTPAATGLDLLARSLPRAPHGAPALEWPAAPDELRELLYHNIGQGRMQVCPHRDVIGTEIPGRYSLDARWMYAACVSHLPVGVPEHAEWRDGADPEPEAGAYLPYVNAWYRVSGMVPPHWDHLGLLPARADGVTLWPDRPGEWIQDAWVSGAELAVVLDNGWPLLIYERWAYPASDHTPGADPTRTWGGKLRALRAGSDAATYGEIAEPMAAAIRHLLIDTVGMWHRREGERLRVTPLADVAANGRVHHLDSRRKLAYWYEPLPLSRDALAWQRPEWSTLVWGRARARLHRAMLRIPRRDILELRTDAIVTRRPIDWTDDGQPGTFRLKERDETPRVVSARG